MSAVWATVEHAETGVPLTTMVGGISLAVRHARMAHRVGWGGLRFLISDDREREQVRASLAREAPAGLAIEVVGKQDAPLHAADVSLEASALYLQDTLSAAGREAAGPKADFHIHGPEDLGAAQRFLYAQIRKSIALDGVIAFYVMRPLARIFTRMLLNTSVSPNQATLAALACGIGAAICAGIGGQYVVFAGVLYWFGGVLDCIDGELARLRLQSSKVGEWLDSMVDEFSTVALITGMGIGLSRDGYGDHWMLLGIGGAILAILTLAPMYTDLHRKGLAIDTAQFPWFFGTATAADMEGPTSFVGKLINVGGYFIRRDANITGTSLLLIFNIRKISLVIMLGAFVVASLLLLTHYAVMRLRNPPAT